MNKILDWKYLSRILPDYYEALGGNGDLGKIIKWKSKASFCDEIIPIKLRKQSRDLIIGAKHKLIWRKVKNKYIKYAECNSRFYKSDNLRLFIVNANNSRKENIIDIVGLADIENGVFLLVGCDFSHPFIECNEFSYANSDGSGPDVFTKGETITPEIIIDKISEYYEEFCDDHPH